MRVRYAESSVVPLGDLSEADHDAVKALAKRHAATGKPRLSRVSADPPDVRRLCDEHLVVFVRTDGDLLIVTHACRDDD